MKNFSCIIKPASKEFIQVLGESHELKTETFLMFLGRLDNKLNVKKEFGIPNEVDDDTLICKLIYSEIQEDIFDYLHGDYSLIIWDSENNTLLCGSDFLGSSNLFYQENSPDKILISTELSTFLSTLSIDRELDYKYIANFLVHENVSHTILTPYKSVKRIRIGHYLRIDKGSLKEVSYWKPNLNKIEFKDSTDYSLELYSMLRSSVYDRIRNYEIIGTDLSGGLDSSSVTCMVKKLTERTNQSIISFSNYFPECDRADETMYIDALLEKYNDIESKRINGNEQWMFKDSESVDMFYEPCASSLFHMQTYAVAKAASLKGVSAYLTGYGGDTVLGSEPIFLNTMLTRFKWNKLYKEIKEWAPYRKESGGTLFFEKALYPSLPYWLKSKISKLEKQNIKKTDALFSYTPDWLKHKFKIYVENELLFNSQYSLDLKCSPEIQYNLKEIIYGADLEYLKKSVYEPLGIDLSHPFNDRRIVEFMLRVPGEVKMKPPYLKKILREAMKGILPETINMRTNKGSLETVPFSGIKKEYSLINKWIKTALVVDYGIISYEDLSNLFSKWRFGTVSLKECYQIFALEHWLRTINGL